MSQLSIELSGQQSHGTREQHLRYHHPKHAQVFSAYIITRQDEHICALERRNPYDTVRVRSLCCCCAAAAAAARLIFFHPKASFLLFWIFVCFPLSFLFSCTVLRNPFARQPDYPAGGMNIIPGSSLKGARVSGSTIFLHDVLGACRVPGPTSSVCAGDMHQVYFI